MRLLTSVISTVYTVRAGGDHRGAPVWYIRSENLTFEEAEKRIDEISKVMQIVISSPSGPNHAPVPGGRAWECKTEGEDRHRTPEAVWSLPDSPESV